MLHIIFISNPAECVNITKQRQTSQKQILKKWCKLNSSERRWWLDSGGAGMRWNNLFGISFFLRLKNKWLHHRGLGSSMMLLLRSTCRSAWCPYLCSSNPVWPAWLLCYQMSVCLCWLATLRWCHLSQTRLQVLTALDHESQIYSISASPLFFPVCFCFPVCTYFCRALYLWLTQSFCLPVWNEHIVIKWTPCRPRNILRTQSVWL